MIECEDTRRIREIIREEIREEIQKMREEDTNDIERALREDESKGKEKAD